MLKYNLKPIIDKYKETVVGKMSNPEFKVLEEINLHTQHIALCSAGNKESKKYVIGEIHKIFKECVSEEDLRTIQRDIINQVNTFNQKQYEKYADKRLGADQVAKISYYELLEHQMSKEQKNKLNDIIRRTETIESGLNDNELALDVLSEEFFKEEYGIGIINDIYDMRINNLEIHDTSKIRVETSKGLWYTIADVTIPNSELVKVYAKRLLSQNNNNGELTDEDCIKTSVLSDNSRLSVSLKPACNCNAIFIKKFDNIDVTKNELVTDGTITQEVYEDMKILAKGRANSAFIGGINAGKSALLKMYTGLFPADLKIGLIDSSNDTKLDELYPDRDIIEYTETAKYSLEDLFAFLLRTNRHSLGISEARSKEVELAIKCATRGNDGLLLTLHTIRNKDLVDNIAWMCLENGIPIDIRILRARIASALDISYRMKHLGNGVRRLDNVTEIVATDNLDKPFEERVIYYWDNNKNVLVRNKDYVPSEDLIDKLEYYGCTPEEIKKFKRA